MKFTCYFMFTFMSFLCSSWTRLLTSVPVPGAWSSGCSVSLQPPVQPWLRVLCCSNDLSLCFLLLDFGHLFTPWPALTQSFPFHPCGLAFFLFCTDFDFDLVPCSLSPVSVVFPSGLASGQKAWTSPVASGILNFVYSAVVIVYVGSQAADYKIVLMCFMNLEEILFFKS